MNKIFKVIFNHTTQTWTAVSELAKGYCKSSSNNTIEVSDGRKESSQSFSSIKTIAITSAMMMAVVPNAFAVKADNGGANTGTIKWVTGQGTAIAGGDAWGDTNSIAIGRNNDKGGELEARAWAPGAIAIGTGSKVGNVQGPDNNARGGIALGYDTSVTGGIRSAAIGSGSRANGETSTAVGGNANANGKGAAALGANTTATGEGATAVGFKSTASQADSIALGNNASAVASKSIVIGANAKVDAGQRTQTVVIGYNATGNSQDSVIIGTNANTNNHNSTAIGINTITSSQYATALGANAKVLEGTTNSVALGAGSEAGSKNTVSDLKFKTDNGSETTATIAAKDANSVLSIGNGSHKRQIVNVAAGRVSQDSTDAINGSQLYAVMTNSGFNIQQNGTPKSRINNDGLVNFTDGNYTTAEVTDGNNSSSVKVNVVTQDITTDTKGVTSVSGNTAGLTTAKTVSDAINNALNNSSFLLKANDDAGEKITRNGSINIAQGKNINVERNGSTITVKTIDNPNFTTVKSGTVNADQVSSKNLTVSGTSNLQTVNINQQLSANGDVNLGGAGKTINFVSGSTINANNNQIKGVADGVSPTDAVNKRQLDAVNTIATTANNTANTANTTANTANTTANTANTTANTANTTANTANTTANTANTTANTANTTANTANTTANTANTTANTANTTANTALDKVNQGWNINTGKVEGGNVEGNSSTNVQMGETVKVIAGKNLNITQNGKEITLSVNDSPSFTSITTSNGATIGGNLTVNGATKLKNVTLEAGSVFDAGGNRLTNLSNATAGNDATTLSQVQGLITNATTNASNINTTNLSAGNATITNLTATNGTITNLNSTNGTITNLNSTNGTITNLNSTNGTITNLNSDNIVANNGTFNTTLVSKGETTLSGNTTIGGANKTFNIANGTTVNMGNNVVSGVANGSNPTDAVNKQQLDAVANTPLNFTGNSGETSRKLGQTLNITGTATTSGNYTSKNVKTVVTEGKVEIQVAENPEFETISTTGNANIGGNLGVNGTTTTKDLNVTNNATVNNLTATNGTITNLNSTNGTITNLNSTNGTITNLNSTNGTITNLNSTNGTITNLNSTNGTITNLNSTNGTITNLNSTNGTVTNLNSTNGTITNLNSTNGTITNLNSTNGTFTNSLVSTGNTILSGNTTVGGEGKTFTVANGTKVDMGGNVISNITDGNISAGSKDAITGGQLHTTIQNITNSLTNQGMNFTGNNGEIIARKLGETLTVQGSLAADKEADSSNIRTISNATTGAIEIVMAKDPTFRNLNATGNATVGGDLGVNGTTTTKDLNVTNNATINNLTATNGTITNLNSTNGTITNLNSTNGTITNLNSTNGTITNLNSTNGTITNLNSTNGTITNLNSTNGTITNLNSTNGTITNLNSTNGTITNLNSTNGTITNLNSTNGTITNLNSTNGTITNLNSTNGTITNLNSTNGTFSNSLVSTGNTILSGNTTVGGEGKTFTVANGTKVDMGGNVISNITDGNISAGSKDAITGGQLHTTIQNITNSLTNQGMNFTGNNGEIIARKLGETLTVQGSLAADKEADSSNIRTISNATTGAIEIVMAKDPTFRNLNATGNATVGGDLGVNGTTTTKDLNVTNNATINNLTATNGTITNLNSTNGTITNLNSTNGTITNLNSTNGTITNLNSTNGTITNLNSTNGTITNLNSTNGTITNLNSTNGTITNLNSTNGTITNLNSTNGTITNLNSTNGTITNLNSTNGTITNLNSTNGTITNLNSTNGTITNLNSTNGTITNLNSTNGTITNLNSTNGTITNLNSTNGTITNLNSTNGTFTNSLVSTGNTILSGNTTVGGEGKTFTVANGTKVDMGGNVISNITDGNISAGSKDAITGGQLHTTIQNITNSLTNQGMNFTGNNGEIIARKLGETLTVQGSLAADKEADSSNIRTISNATTGAIEIVMAKDPTFRNLNATGNATVGGDLGVNGTTTTKDLNVTNNATINNLTATNGTITNLNSTNGTITNLNSTNGTITNLNSTNGTITNLNSTNGTITNLNSTNGTITNLNSTNGTITNLNSTNGTITNLNSTNGTITNLNSTNGTITNLNSTNGTFSNSLVSTGNTILSGNTTVGGEGKTFTVANGTKVDMGGNVISNISDGNISAGSKDAITGGQLHTTIQNITNSLTNQGMNFTGNNGEIIARKLGETLTVQGSLATEKEADSSNIRTVSNATTGAIEIVMAKDPTFRNLNATGNATVGGDLGVNGTTTTKDLNVTNNATIKDLNVTNNATIAKDLTVSGNSTVKGNSTIEGNSTVKGNATFEKDVAVNGTTTTKDLNVTNNATISKDLTVGGNSTVSGDSTVKGNATFEKDVTVNGTTTTKDLNVTNNATISKDLTVGGNSTVSGDSTVKGNATFEKDTLTKGNSTVEGNLTVEKDLNVEGHTSLQDVTIHQSLTLADNAKIDLGNSDIEGNFNIYGDTDKKPLSQALDQLQMTGPLVYVDPKTNKDVQRQTEVVRVNSGSDKPVRVTNVADPKDASDAVNLGYFDKKLSLNMGDVHNRINRVDRRLRSGIASAVAMSLLPQSYRAGESIVSVGGGTYRGASAIAVGYSRVTDNGRVVIKIGGSANNSGDYAGGAAVGWKF